MFKLREQRSVAVTSTMGVGANDSLTNISFLLHKDVSQADPEYEQFLADVWVGIVLTLLVLSCVCCMCSCLLYHKFQQWKRSVIEARQAAEMENGFRPDLDTLPSYTIASGLPSYEEALEQLKHVKELRTSKTVETRQNVQRLSVADLFQIYKNSEAVCNGKT